MNTALTVLRRYTSPLVGVIVIVLVVLPDVLAGGQIPLLAVLTVVLLGGAIAAAAWFPRIALCVAIALLTVQLGFPFALSASRDWPIFLGPALIVFFAASSTSARVRVQALGAALLLTVVATLLYGLRLQQASRQFLFMADAENSQASISFWLYLGAQFTALMVGAWLLGFGLRMTMERFTLVRERAATAEQIRQAELDLVVAGERNRISRELHDVLAHSLAVITAQADGTRYLSKDQSPTVSAVLENIAGTARSALVDAQRVIANLANDAEGSMGIDDVDELIEHMRQGHLTVERTDKGAPGRLTEDQELTVYRIVQESLTNALKHAGFESTATVRFNWDGPGLTLHVTSTPGPATKGKGSHAAGNTGRGINGLRARAEASGGWLTAEPDDHAFITTAFIPYENTEATLTARETVTASRA